MAHWAARDRAAASPFRDMQETRLIVGLGNPGTEYERTRHNAGFLVLDRLAEAWRIDWSDRKRFGARLARLRQGAESVVLCEPLTYMNASGGAVAAVRDFYRVQFTHLLVVVDDADLPLGTLRLRPAGSSGGHHGLESVEQHLGSRDYARLRIGIGRQPTAGREITGHVLGRFHADEQPLLQSVLDRAAAQVECWRRSGVQKAMNDFNGITEIPGPKATD